MLADLLVRIEELGGDEVSPVVPIRLFFEGNDDEASFAPNLVPHPGMPNVYRVLSDIESRPEVSAVVVQIDEVMEPPEWPFASVVYVITSADAAVVNEWAAAIEPDPPAPGDDDSTWLHGSVPPGAPHVPARHRPVVLLWD